MLLEELAKICKLFVDNHEVFIVGRNKEKLESLINFIPKIKDFFVCDISDNTSLGMFFDSTVKKGLNRYSYK